MVTKTVRVANGSYSIKVGQKSTFVAKLTPAGLKLLKIYHRLRVKATLYVEGRLRRDRRHRVARCAAGAGEQAGRGQAEDEDQVEDQEKSKSKSK